MNVKSFVKKPFWRIPPTTDISPSCFLSNAFKFNTIKNLKHIFSINYLGQKRFYICNCQYQLTKVKADIRIHLNRLDIRSLNRMVLHVCAIKIVQCKQWYTSQRQLVCKQVALLHICICLCWYEGWVFNLDSSTSNTQ